MTVAAKRTLKMTVAAKREDSEDDSGGEEGGGALTTKQLELMEGRCGGNVIEIYTIWNSDILTEIPVSGRLAKC